MQRNKQVRHRMLDVGISGLELARQLGISDSKMSKIANGWEVPSPELKQAIAQALRCPQKSLWPGIDMPD
jgi:transcriptional regulator with XRE-family HTH domain